MPKGNHDQRGEKNFSWRGGQSTLVCLHCGKEFKDYHRKEGRERKFCSFGCAYAHRTQRPLVLTCEYCEKQFERRAYDANRGGRFCSRSCRAHVQTAFFKTRGEHHWNWKGGITPEHMKKRCASDYDKWRKFIFEFDHYRCAVCGSDKPRIHAHHILSVSEYPDRIYDKRNGVTLCVKHHQELHPEIVLSDFRKYYLADLGTRQRWGRGNSALLFPPGGGGSGGNDRKTPPILGE